MENLDEETNGRGNEYECGHSFLNKRERVFFNCPGVVVPGICLNTRKHIYSAVLWHYNGIPIKKYCDIIENAVVLLPYTIEESTLIKTALVLRWVFNKDTICI